MLAKFAARMLAALALLGAGCTLLPTTGTLERERSPAADPQGGPQPTADKPAAEPGPPIAPEGGDASPPAVPVSSEAAACPWQPMSWGLTGLRGYAFGEQVAPNGQEFKPLFSLDFDLNTWLWREERLYLFAEMRFWGQKAAQGVTNAGQGALDFSKREFDLDLGAAWNYYGNLEARAFAYSFNNLNRGTSTYHPSGYNDGVGVEQRWYVGGAYAGLGSPGFDVSRAPFVSIGYYPAKDMVDGDGNLFKPGPFARAYLTFDLIGERWYLFVDAQAIATRSCQPKLLSADVGTAFRPFTERRVEFRLGAENRYDPQARELESEFYGSIRFIF